VPDRREVVFPAVLPSEDRLDCRVPADVIRDVAGLAPNCLPRDVLDAFGTHKREVFAPAAERVLAEGRVGDAGGRAVRVRELQRCHRTKFSLSGISHVKLP
jgi:hypothetical protein